MPTGGRQVRLERSPYCGNPGFDDYPPTLVRTIEVGADQRALARNQPRTALRGAGWEHLSGEEARQGDWRRDFGDFTAYASIQTLADEYAYVPEGTA